MSAKRSNLINVGRVTGVFGVKGWVKVKSSTQPEDNIVNYSPWWLKTRHGVKAFEVDEYKFRPQGLVVHIKGIDDRDLAAEHSLVDIAIERSQLPELDRGDFYWHQLVGLKVISDFDGQEYILGVVKSLLETGSNDVLEVSHSDDSMDDRDRLVPYVDGMYVKSIDLSVGQIRVEWDPEF